MGKLAGFGDSNVKLIREGFAYNPDPNATKPLPFCFDVEPDKCTETWGEGLSMYHNPNAENPLNIELFPGIVHHFIDENNVMRSIYSNVHPFFPFNSKTLVISPKY
jgi:hypothetical protein